MPRRTFSMGCGGVSVVAADADIVQQRRFEPEIRLS